MTSFQFAQHERLFAAARHQAALARRQTLDDWIDGAGRLVAHPLRSANRLAASLARHARLRSKQGA